ncbi:MAG TPA: DedA family protein [Jatrophihabitans sp.]|jgi:membrane protein DedA with SNARE-associated domain|uniref:DedA family protein n=1 Tax=Jatrophihabitans sp. TaxID=1932789 RepID=UPI002EFA5FE2
MSVTSTIVEPVLNFSGVPAYALVGGLAFGEAALFFGFLLPGETAVIIGGVLAYQQSVSLTVMSLVVVTAAILGDSVGYEVGKRYGGRLLGTRIFARHQEAIAGAQGFLRRSGGRAVFLGRFTAFLRAVMPGMAGAARMPYRKFLIFNALGGITWGLGFTLLGYLAGASYHRLELYAGRFSQAILLVVLVAVAILLIRRHRAKAAMLAADALPPAHERTSPDSAARPSAES